MNIIQNEQKNQGIKSRQITTGNLPHIYLWIPILKQEQFAPFYPTLLTFQANCNFVGTELENQINYPS